MGSSTIAKSEHNRNLFFYLKWPLLAYGILFGAYSAMLPGKFVWFSWHPLGMLIGFVTLAGNAALIKKIGGYDNTKIHGYLMSAACIMGGFAWYVIYSNKEKFGKKHLTTLHGKLGCTVMCGYVLIGIGGAAGLHPDWGLIKTNQTFRAVHKWAGRLFTMAAWACCVLGFMTMQSDVTYQVGFALPLLIMGFFALL